MLLYSRVNAYITCMYCFYVRRVSSAPRQILLNRYHCYKFLNYEHSTTIFISEINQIDAQNFCFTIRPSREHYVHETATYRCDDTGGCVMQFWPPDDEHMCSKHVEAWNKLIVKRKCCASSWLNTEKYILKCTVIKTSKKFCYKLLIKLLGLHYHFSLLLDISFSSLYFICNSY